MSHSAAVIGRSGSTAYRSGTDRYRRAARLPVREEQVARAAGAHQAGLLQVRDMPVFGSDDGRAELALLLGRRAALALGRPPA